jgi:low affinity Fe/Cu permease
MLVAQAGVMSGQSIPEARAQSTEHNSRTSQWDRSEKRLSAILRLTEPAPHGLSLFRSLAQKASNAMGRPSAFIAALGTVIVWACLGPVFHYSDTWQLVINTGTTIVTFLMVFLIQRGQNKDALAIQLKLNELVAAVKGASNRLISIEDLSEDEVRVLQNHYRKLVELAKQDDKLTESHSIEDAELDHAEKLAARRRGAGEPTAAAG